MLSLCDEKFPNVESGLRGINIDHEHNVSCAGTKPLFDDQHITFSNPQVKESIIRHLVEKGARTGRQRLLGHYLALLSCQSPTLEWPLLE